MQPYIYSIQIGKKKKLKNWETASFKDEIPVVEINYTGIIGDEVADTKNHGGFEKAIFANSFENYPYWCEFLGVDSLPYGSLGENLTISGLNETNVYLGDIHQIGEVILQVVQPRKPCWKISKKHNKKEFTKHIFNTGKTGWYYKVIKKGTIKKNDTLSILSIRKSNILYQYVTNQKVSIFEANNAFKDPHIHQKVLKRILTLSGISNSYKESIKKRFDDNYDLGFMELPNDV